MLLVAVPAARAADPIMPLSEVRQGMRCTGLSVIQGTTISSFDVEILDVIAPEAGLSGPRILIRVSGPAVDETGIGPGFSGSPVICDGRNAGAISEGLGEYGNHVALATPIEGMLEDRPTAPASARRDPALLRAARPLQTPLTVSGLTGPARTLVERAARRANRPLLVAPAGPAGGYAPVDLRPGAALSAAISTGDLGLGAVGTVTYRDGEDIWAFGHPFEGLGRRALFLHGRLHLHGDPEPGRRSGARGRDLQAGLERRARARLDHERHRRRDRRQGRNGPALRSRCTSTRATAPASA